jgi:Domain of unknown function (DUF4384)
MSPKKTLFSRFGVSAIAMLILAQHAFAAVLILEGSAPASPPVATPGRVAPQDEQAAPAPSPSPGESGILNPATGPAASAPPPAAIVTGSPAPPTDLGTAKTANSAEISIEMLPGLRVSVGSRVSFRVTSKKAGYLVLVDVDATGHLTQIYPNAGSLPRASRPNSNYIKAGGTLTIPLASDPYAGIQYVVSPPNGQAMVVAILSAQPVQILDLPDVPDLKDKSDMLAFLSKWTNELRIPDDASHLRETRWSLNATSYTIE